MATDRTPGGEAGADFQDGPLIQLQEVQKALATLLRIREEVEEALSRTAKPSVGAGQPSAVQLLPPEAYLEVVGAEAGPCGPSAP